MKSFLVAIALLAAAATSSAAEVNFRDISFDDARKAAAQEGKYLMVDGFTEWCYWCKVLDKNVYPNDTVAEFMNKNFVCIKLDMERGFGKIFSAKYRVNAYPTGLVFSPAGKLVFVNAGYEAPRDYIKVMQKALDPKTQESFAGITDVMEPGFPKFYMDAIDVNGKRTFPDSLTVLAYLDAQKDLFNEVAYSVLARFLYQVPKYHDHFLKNSARYAELFGKDNVDQHLASIFSARTKAAVQANDNAAFTAVLGDVDRYALRDKDNLKSYLSSTYYAGVKAWDKYATLMDAQFAKDNYTNANGMNSAAWTIYEGCDDQTVLTKATGWMSKAIALEPSYACLDTYAALLFKTKDFTNAEKYANLAIDAAKRDKEKFDTTKELLEKIEKKLGKSVQ